jgi:Ca-activated chloride channel family protein
MQGKLSSLTEGVVDGIGKMRPEDRVEIVTFNEKATRETSGFVPVDEAGRKRLTDLVRSLQSSGSTNLYAGLSQGLDLIDADRPTAIVLVTDGVANVGNTEKKSFLDLVQKKDVRLFTLVMGNSANRPLLESLTSHSGGYAENVSNSDDIAGKVLSVTNKISHAALYDVAVEIDGVNVTDLKPQRIGTLYAGQQLVLFGHYHKSGPADVTIKAKISGEAKKYETQFVFPENAARNPEVGRLWAFAAIEELMDAMSTYGEDDDRVQAVTDLAVSNGLVTPYTSMLVLQEDVFAARNIERQNKVRLAVEETAREERRKQPIQQTRVDANRPAFNGNQPTYSSPKSGGGKGSGAINLPALLLILAAFAAVMLRQRRQAHV